jgi:hypothetical protein
MTYGAATLVGAKYRGSGMRDTNCCILAALGPELLAAKKTTMMIEHLLKQRTISR